MDTSAHLSGESPGKRLFRSGIRVSVGWCLLSFAFLFLNPGWFDILDWKLYDLKLRAFSKPTVNENIVHVDVDDSAIEAYGQWPWDREKSARIVERLTEFGARAVVFDILYSTRGKSAEGDEALFKAVADSRRVVSPLAPIRLGEKGDPLLQDADPARADALYEKAWHLRMPPNARPYQITELRNSGLPVLPVIRSSHAVGHIKATPDPDDIYRRVPLFLRLKDRLVPSLGLAALVAAEGADPANARWTQEGLIEIPRGGEALSIPVDAAGNLLIHWKPSWESFKGYSAVDLLSETQDTTRPSRYRDKIVIIGVACTGTSDIGASPLESELVLSRVQSAALDTIMNGRFLTRMNVFPSVLLGALVVTLGFIAIGSRLDPGKQIFVAFIVPILLACISVAVFFLRSVDVPLIQPMLVYVPAAAALILFKSLATEQERKDVRDVFGRYVSDEVVEEILKWPGGVNLNGELREVTFLVSDLRGFTPLTESHSPLVVVETANRYFERMTEIVSRHRGTINEIMGDGMLMFFGAPRPMADHPQRAVACALEMQQAMEGLNVESERLGLPALKMGIGINTGIVVLGSIGSEKRRKYTGYGSSINIAFRLESNALPGEILISPAVYQRLSRHLEIGSTREVKLKGIETPMLLYSLTGLRSDDLQPSDT
ncbi:MAG: adenylate/guanylate cyclase domain-containing protein [Desulfomonile tiedjei]|nr:adenylate/guanylate cyclase domain-containing protein [Desulfomonile tiedjei]